MLDQARTRYDIATDMDLASTVTTRIEDGSALVRVLENSVAKAALSAGSSGEVFVGVAFSQWDTPTTAKRVETYTVPASSPYTITLPKIPTSGKTAIKTAAGTLLTIGSASNAGEYAVSSAVVTFNSAQASTEITITYDYALTVAEAVYLAGDGIPGKLSASQVVKSIGVLRNATVFTSMYDAAIDWSAASPTVKTGAGGNFTVGGNGATVNGYVVQAPTNEVPFLGLRFNA